MRVIEKGNPQTGWAKRFKCTGNGNGGGGCKALLLVEEGDIFQTQRNALSETDYFNTFKCQECGVLTDLPETEFLPFKPKLNHKQWEAKRLREQKAKEKEKYDKLRERR